MDAVNDSKRIILKKLIECNPNTPNLQKLGIDDFKLSDIKEVPEKIINGEVVNSKVRLITSEKKGWVGSRYLWFKREDFSTTVDEQYCWYPKEKLPARAIDVLDHIFDSMNLPFDPYWMNVSKTAVINQNIVSLTIWFNSERSLLFTGTIRIHIRNKYTNIHYIKHNELKLFTPLLVDDKKTNLIPYSFEFLNKMSSIKGWDKIPLINSQESLNTNLSLVLNVISDLSKEEWTNEANLAAPRPGGYFKFVHNGELNREIINSIFGKDIMLPINMRYQHALILHLDTPPNSLSKYVGYLFLYWL